jgi:hypothetical protein
MSPFAFPRRAHEQAPSTSTPRHALGRLRGSGLGGRRLPRGCELRVGRRSREWRRRARRRHLPLGRRRMCFEQGVLRGLAVHGELELGRHDGLSLRRAALASLPSRGWRSRWPRGSLSRVPADPERCPAAAGRGEIGRDCDGASPARWLRNLRPSMAPRAPRGPSSRDSVARVGVSTACVSASPEEACRSNARTGMLSARTARRRSARVAIAGVAHVRCYDRCPLLPGPCCVGAARLPVMPRDRRGLECLEKMHALARTWRSVPRLNKGRDAFRV